MIYYKLNNDYLKADELSLEDILGNDLIVMLVKQDIESQIPNLVFDTFTNYEDMVNSYSKFLLSSEDILNEEFKEKRLSMLYDKIINGCDKYGFEKTEAMKYLQNKLTKMGIF